ncbi:MAG: sulfotransferase, partial [Cyanobacteria bacterium P01_D01_bin.50]
MKNLLDISNKLIDAAKLYIPSAYGGLKNINLWQEAETFCLFLGYPRSGHSMIGALLNAHPNIIMSHEAAALKYVYVGFDRNQIYDIIFKKAKFSAEKDRKLGGYNYYVPNQWQGRVEKLKVIGDK